MLECNKNFPRVGERLSFYFRVFHILFLFNFIFSKKKSDGNIAPATKSIQLWSASSKDI